jgi:hypothetical protein
MKPERRTSPRKEVCPLTISSISIVESMAKIARSGMVVNASNMGVLIQIKRNQIIPRVLKNTLSLDVLIGDAVVIKIEEMNLEIFGRISRTKLLGKQGFELAIDYSAEAPLYWRECLIDLLPSPEEFLEIETERPTRSGSSLRATNLVPLKSVKSR